MPIYPTLAVAAGIAVVALELFGLRTGLFRDRAYWISMAICFAFMIPVDGWLTKLSAPLVLYEPAMMLGVRFPWDIPVEDFGFGFSMVTLTIICWIRLGREEKKA